MNISWLDFWIGFVIGVAVMMALTTIMMWNAVVLSPHSNVGRPSTDGIHLPQPNKYHTVAAPNNSAEKHSSANSVRSSFIQAGMNGRSIFPSVGKGTVTKRSPSIEIRRLCTSPC